LNPVSPDKRIAFGLVTMTIAVLILAQLFGILPDNKKAQLQNRKALIENLAIQVTQYAANNQTQQVRKHLNAVTERNPEILSSAIRNARGYILIEVGPHRKNWTLRSSDKSTSEQVQLMIHAGRRQWGNLELRFKPISSNNVFGVSINNSLLLIVFVGVLGYFLYGYLLRKTLTHLDPNAVIPDRVKNAMNIISEGLLILDDKERIILANNAFAQLVGVDAETLTGKSPKKMNWRYKSGSSDEMPWTQAQKSNRAIAEAQMSLQTKKFGQRSFLVNAAPITGEDKKVRGSMVTFNDVTQLQLRNTQLNKAVHTLKKSQAEVAKKNKELAFLASRDPLTGCLNRRAFFETVEPQFRELIQSAEDFSCVMLDIDHFKLVNDTYGHGVGDNVIKTLARTILDNMRNGDLACRYGGEEFVLYLKDSDATGAVNIAERIRQQVEKLDFSTDPATKDMKITSSFGIADSHDKAMSLNELIEQADQALYFSKENGRNQVNKWSEIKDNLQDENTTIDNVTELTTGRPGFIRLLNSSIHECNELQQGLVVFLIDIDMFKRINNTLGHQTGDEFIEETRQRLVRQFSQGSCKDKTDVFNLKGDEFGIICRTAHSLEQISAITDKIQQAIKIPFRHGDKEINLTCSIGSSIYPQDGESAEVLLRNIEAAINHAKDRGGQVHQPYLAEFNTSTIDTLEIENKLHNALKNNELYLHYQPKVDLNTGRITGLEALARWRNPDLGDISPGQFIPIAEQSGLINELGLWVLKTACLQANKWIQAGLIDLRVAVNLSAVQLKKNDFLDRVMAIFDETGFPPGNLELEVTENMMMENIETVTPILYELHEQGVEIAIDDFGIGYSSLNYIKRFPISVIKIDRSFIMHIEDDMDDHAIVSAIIAMAHAMNLKVVAEGAEHSQQIDILRRLKCDQLQGFIFSKPLPFEEATRLLLNNAKSTTGPKSIMEQVQKNIDHSS